MRANPMLWVVAPFTERCQLMNNAVEFYRVATQNRIQLQDFRNQAERLRAILYVNKAFDLAQVMGIEDFPVQRLNLPDAINNDDLFYTSLFQVEDYLNKIYANNLFELDAKYGQQSIFLDENWRGKVSSYISHIRSELQKAKIEQRLQQSIMKKLNELQTAVDKNQARVDAAIDIFLDLTVAAGEGAKNLEPAIGLGKKLWVSLRKLKRTEAEEEPKRQLPAPEELGLEDLREQNEE